MTQPDQEAVAALVNSFIEKWCGDNAAHLLDTDDNDGQTLREALLALQAAATSEAYDAGQKDGLIKWADSTQGKIDEAVAETKESVAFAIISTKTEGIVDNGDVFIKQEPLNQTMINIVGYEKFKAMQEAVARPIQKEPDEQGGK
jgi:hypothetical protein